MPRKPTKTKKARLSPDRTNHAASIATKAAARGFKTTESYLRWLVERDEITDTSSREVHARAPKLALTTSKGEIWCGDSLAHLRSLPAGSVDLIFTSPPFALVFKKSYGNEDAVNYCDWFRPFATEFKRVLKSKGSLVIDIGGAWKKGTPTRSLYHFKLLIMLCEEFGLHLCQEHFWWNPSRLPTPAEWVNVRRIRVKDAVNCIWWLSKTPWPAAYSDAMHVLFKAGYKAKKRPSGHDISAKFSRNNGGAVPPNLLAVANTESSGRYQDYCNRRGLPVHPARFPELLPEYFVRLLTKQGDLVIDPFAGSCTTGAVAERLDRKWACVEINPDYVKGAKARFAKPLELASPKPSSYSIHTPLRASLPPSHLRQNAKCRTQHQTPRSDRRCRRSHDE
jgi:DNA modification methylase